MGNAQTCTSWKINNQDRAQYRRANSSYMTIIAVLAVCCSSLNLFILESFCLQFERSELSDAAVGCHSNHTAAFCKRDAVFLASVFTSAWRKLRAKVGHAWDKCWYICQRNQTTKLAGTMPLMSRAESFLCDLIIASQPEILWTMHWSTVVVHI